MGAVSALLLVAAFAAAPAPEAFRFDGPSASATVGGGPVAVRIGGAVREGTGAAFLRGEDRVRGREMTYGDAGQLWMRAQVGGDVYRVELDAVGFPPEAALPGGAGARRAWWRKGEAAPRGPEGGVEGGVVLGRVVNGGAGLGVRDLPARRAAVALWGIGRLYRNDELVAARARILAQAVPGEAPASSREGTLPGHGARPELDVFVDHLPASVAPGGFVHFVLEGAAISEAPRPAAVARRGEAAPAPRRETREERLSRRPTTEELWSSGGPMIVWRDERAPAPGTGAASGAPATASPGTAVTGQGTTAGAPSGAATATPHGSAPSGANAAAGAGGTVGAAPLATYESPGVATSSGATGAAASNAGPGIGTGAAPVASTGAGTGTGAAPVAGAGGAPATGAGMAYGAAPVAGASSPPVASALPDTRPGASTVMIPPPPLLNVPATPLTAPIQYETGQNGGTIGLGQIGGGGFGAPIGYGGSGTSGFSPGTGAFNQTTPPPSGVFAPGTPAPGTPPGATMASPGIPATPPILNNGTTAAPTVPSGAPTALPQTPQPINAQPAPIPGATAPIPTQLPSQTQLSPPPSR